MNFLLMIIRKPADREFALFDQISNSIWSLVMIRSIYAYSDSLEIALIGITLVYSYGCCGYLRSKFVHPLYGGFESNFQNQRFDIVPILKKVFFKYFFIFILCFVIYLFFSSAKSFGDISGLVTLMASIVLLDLLRSFLQLNSDYFFACFVNIFGLIVFLILMFLSSIPLSIQFLLNSRNTWTFCNFAASALILGYLAFVGNQDHNLISPFENLNFEKLSLLSKIEFIQSRIFNLIGSAVILNINVNLAADFTLALYFYSTLPFSIINGLSPYYLRNRNNVLSNLSLRKYFIFVFLSTIVVPILGIFHPNTLGVIFGTIPQISVSLMFLVLLMVFQKTHESAVSLDYMIQASISKYISLKISITISIYLINPILIGLGHIHFALVLLLFVIILQISLLRNSKI